MSQLSLNLNAVSLQNNNANGFSNLNNNANLNNNGVQANSNNKNGNSNAVSGNAAAEKGNSKTTLNQTAQNNAEKEKELSKQIQSDINPAPMLSTAMLFKWDSNAGGAVVNIVDFKTGKVLAQIPPDQVLKMMSNYQKGALYNNKL
jgi:flagellar protein FlaG